MRVQVRKCRFTGKIFEEKDLKKYAVHLKKLREERAEKRKIDKVRATFTSWLNREKKKILHPEEIPAWFLKNQRKIMDAVNAGFGDRAFESDKFFNTDEFTKFSFESVRYSKTVSNTHVCPKGGVLNWHCKDDLPKGYPGWTTHVNGALKRNRNHMGSYPYSGALNAVGLKTGSGGGGNESWGFGISIFLADWPGLQYTVDEMEKDQIVAKLKGTV
jgi:hypothetical protein